MEKAFRAANDWRLQTSQGILNDAAAQDDSLKDDEDENKLTRRMNLFKSSVEAEDMKKYDFYYGVLGVIAPKRKNTAIEAALELRSQDRTKMEAELNIAKVKAEKLGAIMAVARQLREADEDLSFSDAMKQAKEIYEDI
ncbi:unnamed protein product [Tilletia controversa]|nr:unnamed protein product [Tilletia controversa]